jgi:hypothetical protein
VRVDRCSQCHDVATAEDLSSIRMIASKPVDFDGDGDREEGIRHEIDGLRGLLLSAIEAYGRDVAGLPIVYDEHSHPYFFADANGNGAVDAGEGKYTAFTPRLLRAAYNYQFATKDPGAFAHNAKYVMQLLHDSMSDLNGALPAPLDLSATNRDDTGHFNGSDEPARHWDEDGAVSSSCAKCHSGSAGYAEYLTYHMNTEQPVNNGLDCATCHTTFDTFETRLVSSVTFPGEVVAGTLPAGTAASDPKATTNLCATCHTGRESKKTIDDYIATGKTGFRNVHYLPAAGVLFGTDAKVGYEYAGKTYAAKFTHFGANSSSYNCVFCHAPRATEHSFDVNENIALCQQCHAVTDLEEIRMDSTADYDGDGDATETLDGEIHGLADALYARMRAVTGATPILYDEHSHPYFFKDLDADGVVDPGENASANGYKPWTPALMKAAHNFQISHKEPGAWAHNFAYMAQLLIDSIQDLGGDVSAYTRP